MWARIYKAFKRHGPDGFVKLVFYNIFYYAQSASPMKLRARRSDRRFDQDYGTDTSSVREIGSLAIPSSEARHGKRYQPSGGSLFHRIVEQMAIDYERFVFVDFGSGKGRVILLASTYPFKKIIGVDFSPELDAIAGNNLERFRSPEQKCTDISLVCCDAANFVVPAEPLVCYFYNPFDEIVMKKVATNIERSLLTSWRDIYIIYVEPVHKGILDHPSWWKHVRDEVRYCVYRSAEFR